jgi:hypothetical protein
MKKQLVLMMALALFATVGCVSTNEGFTSAGVPVTVEPVWLTADIELGEDVTGTSETMIILKLIKLGDSQFADNVSYGAAASTGGKGGLLGTGIDLGPSDVDTTKAAAAYKAIKGKGDVIVHPRYEVVVTDFFVFGTVKATVWGKAGKITNIAKK